MPKEKAEKSLCMSGLRHAEYYGMQEVFDGLYAKSSKNETFTNLMNIILKRENILLAYRNIKSNDGSKTPGTDGVTFISAFRKEYCQKQEKGIKPSVRAKLQNQLVKNSPKISANLKGQER